MQLGVISPKLDTIFGLISHLPGDKRSRIST